MEINQNNENQNQMRLPEPTVSGTYGHGWEIMKKNFPELLLVILLQMLLSLPMGFSRVFHPIQFDNLMTGGFFQLVYSLLVLGPVSYGSSWVFLKAVRGEPFKVQDIFFAYQSFGNVVLAQILVWLIVVAGIIMLIVPGIIFACKLAFVPYLVMDEKLEYDEGIYRYHFPDGFNRDFRWHRRTYLFYRGYFSGRYLDHPGVCRHLPGGFGQVESLGSAGLKRQVQYLNIKKAGAR